MKRISRSMLIMAFSIATVCAGGKGGCPNESGTPNVQSKAEKHSAKPVRWLRRIGAVDVQFPLWLSSRGIPNAKSEIATTGQSYQFSVRQNAGAAETLPEIEP